jgi:excisionase family DNA binding protein
MARNETQKNKRVALALRATQGIENKFDEPSSIAFKLLDPARFGDFSESLRRAFRFWRRKKRRKEMFDSSASISEYRTAKELAREWRVSVQHVLGLVRCGRLPAHRIGGRVIIPRDGAESYLQSVATVKAA